MAVRVTSDLELRWNVMDELRRTLLRVLRTLGCACFRACCNWPSTNNRESTHVHSVPDLIHSPYHSHYSPLHTSIGTPSSSLSPPEQTIHISLSTLGKKKRTTLLGGGESGRPSNQYAKQKEGGHAHTSQYPSPDSHDYSYAIRHRRYDRLEWSEQAREGTYPDPPQPICHNTTTHNPNSKTSLNSNFISLFMRHKRITNEFHWSER